MAEEYHFALDVARWVEKMKGTQDEAIRAIGMQILGRIIERSPVGDPKRWKINRAYALSVQHAKKVNAAQRIKNGGRLKRGQKKHASALVSFKTKSGQVTFRQRGWAAKEYTGGRFRGNWQVTFNRPAANEINRIDKSGKQTLEAGNAILATFDADQHTSIWFTNNVPYARRLEYGWSGQAPEGIVRVTVAQFRGKV